MYQTIDKLIIHNIILLQNFSGRFLLSEKEIPHILKLIITLADNNKVYEKKYILIALVDKLNFISLILLKPRLKLYNRTQL